MLAKNILEIKNLIVFPEKNKKNILVNDVSFSLERGKLTCIVGESGSGKSLTALSIIKLLSSQLKAQGIIHFEKNDLSLLNEKKLREYRGKEISMIFQDPMTSLNPVFTVGYQVAEALHAHNNITKSEAKKWWSRLFKMSAFLQIDMTAILMSCQEDKDKE
jgi:ABC-type microcin C transport system duplicated ATPase subunit YejF